MKKSDLLNILRLPLDRVTVFLNARSLRERNMMIGFICVFLLVLDYLLILSPMIGMFQEAAPKISALESTRTGLLDDRSNASKIKQKWEQMKLLAEENEKVTIPSTATAALLESLSKEAGKTGVKITSVQPAEAVQNRNSKLFMPLPIKLSGVAGTHELGRFLSRLESGETFYRVNNLSIKTSPLNERRHQIEIMLEACQREADKPAAQPKPVAI